MRVEYRAPRGRLKEAALERLRDAEALADRARGWRGGGIEPDRWAGVRYLAGIAVECQAKWVLCERERARSVDEIDEALTRGAGIDLRRCLERAGLLNSIERSPRREDWEIVRHWDVAWRYLPPG